MYIYSYELISPLTKWWIVEFVCSLSNVNMHFKRKWAGKSHHESKALMLKRCIQNKMSILEIHFGKSLWKITHKLLKCDFFWIVWGLGALRQIFHLLHLNQMAISNYKTKVYQPHYCLQVKFFCIHGTCPVQCVGYRMPTTLEPRPYVLYRDLSLTKIAFYFWPASSGWGFWSSCFVCHSHPRCTQWSLFVSLCASFPEFIWDVHQSCPFTLTALSADRYLAIVDPMRKLQEQTAK
jgi:hypothetical protein